MNEQEVWEALTAVIDPELGIDIVELGLVYEVAVSATRIDITMTLTTQGCPLHDVIVSGVERALDRPDAQEVDVKVVFDPPWDPSRIGMGGLHSLGAPGS